MAIRLIATGLTFIAGLTSAVVVLAALVIVLNGYSESDAVYGLVACLGLSLVVTAGTSAAAFVTAKKLSDRELSSVATCLIAGGGWSLAGIALNIVCGIIGVGTTEFVRVYF